MRIRILGVLGLVVMTTTALKGQDAVYFGQTPPGDSAELFAPGVIDDDVHSSPVFSPGGDIVLWSVLGDGGIRETRLEDGGWTNPRPPSFVATFADGGDSPVFAPGGRRLYFISNGSTESRARDDHDRIWCVENLGSGWSKPTRLDPNRDLGSLHWQIGVSSKGTIVFSSDREGVIGDFDLFITRRVGDHYTEPENMGRPINHEYSDATAYLDPQERFLIYASVGRHDGRGRADLYASFRRADGRWGEPVNLGDGVNSTSHELCPSVSPDGRYLFFVSARTGASRPYWVDMNVVLRLDQR